MERYLIKFSKTGETKFISHLDVLRTLHRAMKRAGIPISYSKGFNPHPSISVAAPLSLGIASLSEYVDIDTEEAVDEKEMLERLNNALPQGIRVLDVLKIEGKMPSSMGIVESADYRITLKHSGDRQKVSEIINSVNNMDEIVKVKRTKSGEKPVNIRPLIVSINIVEENEDSFEIQCVLKTGSKATLSPELFVDAIKDISEGNIFGYPGIIRNEIYCFMNNRRMDLKSFFSGK